MCARHFTPVASFHDKSIIPFYGWGTGHRAFQRSNNSVKELWSGNSNLCLSDSGTYYVTFRWILCPCSFFMWRHCLWGMTIENKKTEKSCLKYYFYLEIQMHIQVIIFQFGELFSLCKWNKQGWSGVAAWSIPCNQRKQHRNVSTHIYWESTVCQRHACIIESSRKCRSMYGKWHPQPLNYMPKVTQPAGVPWGESYSQIPGLTLSVCYPAKKWQWKRGSGVMR